MESANSFPSEEMARNATRVWYLAKTIKVALVSSLDAVAEEAMRPDGDAGDLLFTRPLRARFEDDSNIIWFIQSRRSALAGLVRPEDSQPLLVTFSDGADGDHIVFKGGGSLSDDRGLLEKLWDRHADIHFPEGPADGEAVLIRFEPRTARFWTGGQGLVSFVVRYIAAKVTGESQRVGAQGVVM